MKSNKNTTNSDLEIISTNLESNFNEVNKLLDNSVIFFNRLDNSVNNFNNIFLSLKEVDVKLKQIDANLEMVLKDYDLRIEKVKFASSLLKTQFEITSARIDSLLDHILVLNESNDKSVIESRTQLFEIVKNFSEINANIFISFLSI